MSECINTGMASSEQVNICFDGEAVYDEGWKVEKIVAVLEKNEERYYKVKWTRYIWQSEVSLQPIHQLITNYWQENSAVETSTNENSVHDEQQMHAILTVNEEEANLTQLTDDQTICQDDEQNNVILPVSEDVLPNVSVCPNQSMSTVPSALTYTSFSMSSREKKFNCDTCGKSFDRRTSLQRHALIHTGQKPWHCDYCGKSFNQNSILQRHLLVHGNQKMFQCEACGKTFIEKGGLRRHAATHSSEKSWVCDECGKCFILKEYLSKHMFLHTGKKPHECSICSRPFADSSALRRHVNAIHKHSNVVCNICHKQFRNSNVLKKHEEKCIGHSCLICATTFENNYVLSTHIETHRGPFKCEQCAIECETYQQFSAHVQEHNITVKRCNLCPNKNFMTIHSLGKHLSKYHSGSEHCDEYSIIGENITPTDNDKDGHHERVPNSFDELFKSALIP